MDTCIEEEAIEKILDSITTSIGNALILGEDVKITEFGTFKIKEVMPRRIKNVNTGEYQITDFRRKINFSPSRELKNAIN